MAKLLLKTHRVLGATLSLFFLMWFLSAFVMLFRSFPSISQSERLSGYREIQLVDSMRYAVVDEVLEREAGGKWTEMSLKALPLEAGFELKLKRPDSLVVEHTKAESAYTGEELQRYAENVGAGREIIAVDTFYQPDTWVPALRAKKAYPLIRYSYDDEAKTQLYVSQEGEGVQLTTASSRFWAYLGAIPHWIYFYQLRQHRDAWVWVITIISGLGTIMCLTGLWLGIRSYIATRRSKRGLHIPYKKWDYRWHHILGLLFGFFVSTYIFSGMMSVQRMPEALVPTKLELGEQLKHQPLVGTASDWQSMIRKALDEYRVRAVKQLTLRSMAGIDYIRLDTDSSSYYLCEGAQGQLETLYISPTQILQHLRSLSPNTSIKLDTLTSYDNYYIDRHKALELPVYKITLDNEDESSIYLNPRTGELRYYDRNARWSRLLYQGLHSWVFAPLVARPALWWTLIILTLLAGLALSITSLTLAYRYFVRQRKARPKD